VGGKGGAGAAGGGSDVQRNAEVTDLAAIDPDVEVGLTQLKRNDEMLDQQLDLISKGMTRLKGIANDQSNEVKLQSVMIDQISDNMDKATDHLNDVNVKLKDTLQKAGGATNVIVKLILLILLCAIGAYIYKMFA
jgi:t-SNARE complex subunit (syntaxin)